jgi:hypothetical protein
MSIDHEQRLERPASPIAAMPDVTSRTERAALDVVVTAARGSPEGRYFSGPGKPLLRRMTGLRDRMPGAKVRAEERRAALSRAECADEERKRHHRGGDRPWLLRLLILAGALVESLTAYVAMEVLVTSQALAVALATLTALVGTGMACFFAHRRLSDIAVPTGARLIEAAFVAVLTVLRYESLSIQGAGVPAAAGAAALSALISALALVGIEELVVETRTFSIFVSTLRVAWKRWRFESAATRLSRVQAEVEAVAEKFQQGFLGFLLRTEGLPLDEARRCAAALKRAYVEGDDAR